MASPSEYGQPIWLVAALALAAGLFALVGFVSSVYTTYKIITEPEKEAPRRIQKTIIEVRWKQLLERIQLEIKVRQCTLLLILCVVYTFLFFCAWYMYCPPGELFAVHARLESVLGLEKASEISSAEQIYTFAQQLGARNAKLQPNSMDYWCEERYFTRTWDPITSQQQVTCSLKKMSTNLASLPNHIQGLFANPGMDVVSASPDPPDDGPCADKNVALSKLLGKSSTCVTVVGQAADWCNYDVGIGLCPLTCNRCGPYKYKRMQDFVGPTITVLPVVIYQTRFETKKCDGFAKKFESSPAYNSENFFNPPLDGHRASGLAKCIDRSKQQNTSYAVQMPCPDCTDGLFQDTPRWHNEFDGSVVYPKLLLEPQTDAEKMSAIQWIDGQTGTVVLSALAYTEGLDIFTRVKVEFEFTDAGGVKNLTRLDSFRRLRSGSRTVLITSTILIFVVCISAMILVFRFTPEVDMYSGFEYLSKMTTMFMTGIIMICALGTDPRSQFKVLVETMAGAADPTTDPGRNNVLVKFFKAAEYFDEIKEMNQWITILAYVTACVLVLQVMKYLHEHPGSAVFSATTIRALERLLYLFFLFCPLFLFLAFLAFCFFGYELSAFATYGDALIAHVRMMYGDVIEASNVSELNTTDTALFWIHALVFMLVTFVVLRFTFLAVIVDAFYDVKKETPQIAREVLSDVADSFLTLMHFQQSGWPDQNSIIENLHEWVESTSASENDLFTPVDLSPACREASAESQEKLMTPEKLARRILQYYSKKIPEVSCSSEAEESAEGVRPLDATRLGSLVVHEVTKRLAEKDPQEADTFVGVGLLSFKIASEFRKCGLIKPDSI